MSDTPEEPVEGEPEPSEGVGGEDAESPLRGWIDPDDRLWRHPSEVPGPRASGPVVLQPPPGRRHRGALMVLVAAVAVAAVVAFVVVLLSPASDHPPTSGTPDTGVATAVSTLPGAANAVPAVALAAGRSIVRLQATTSHGIVALIGLAVAEGGLVVTTADALGGLQQLSVVGSDGALESATVVGQDRRADVALIQVPNDVPVAPFADDTALVGGAPDYTLTMRPHGSDLVLGSVTGAVTAVGTTITSGPADGMPAITSAVPAALATTPASAAVPGEPLLNAAGQVLGILYLPAPGVAPSPAPSTTATTTPLLTGGTYLPTSLVVGVAGDIRAGTDTQHGWLGVTGTDRPGGTGAAVTAVAPASPAVGHLAAGQVIVSVDGQAVHSMAELKARVYVLTPGTAVALTVGPASGSGAETVVHVTLGRSS